MQPQEKIPALFLHIQKTAGTSIIETVRHHYGADMTSHGDCWGHAPESFEDVKFVSGHIGYNYAAALLPGRFSFTFLRNPVERILSMYFFCKGRNSNEFMIYRKANELSLEDFLLAGLKDPWVKKNIWNNQVWQLAHGYAHLDNRTIDNFSGDELLDMAKSHLENISYVGFTETVDQDFPFILSRLQMRPDTQLPKANVTNMRPLVNELPDTLTDIMAELTSLDWKLYEHAKAKLSPIK